MWKNGGRIVRYFTKPVNVPNSEYYLDVDMVVLAIGQQVEETYQDDKLALNTNWNGTFNVDKKTYSTNIEGIFAGGDCVTGPDTVVEAIRAGKIAAQSIDKYLGGKGVYTPLSPERVASYPILEETKQRVKMDTLSKEERLSGFKEVELGFSEEQALQEAVRCLRCDIRE